MRKMRAKGSVKGGKGKRPRADGPHPAAASMAAASTAAMLALFSRSSVALVRSRSAAAGGAVTDSLPAVCECVQFSTVNIHTGWLLSLRQLQSD